MLHEGKAPASPILIGCNKPVASQKADSALVLENEMPTNSLASAMLHGVSYGANEFDHDFMAQFHAPVPAVPSSLGDLVSDAGYSLEPFDKTEEIRHEQSSDLVGFGTQFDLKNEERPNSANTIENLEAWVRERRQESAEPKSPFLPINQLGRCMTRENIQKHLHQAGVGAETEHYTAALLQLGKQSRQRIFAILCMIGLSAQIGEFIRAGIYDTDLPFKFKNDMVFRDTHEGSGVHERSILTLRSKLWTPMHCEAFERYQGQLLAPILKLSWTAAEKVLHFSLKDQFVLPFMEMKDTSKDNEFDATIQHEGGTSVVRKVKIHPAHYNEPPTTKSKSDTYFAVKELKVGYKADREAVALKRFHDKRHPHLIRLLATYTYRGRFSLVFSWADGNLKEFWKTLSPPISQVFRQAAVARWMSTQILGLAQALKVIHYCEINKTNVHHFTDDQLDQTHGRHGDLKPENILWFDENESGQRKDKKESMGLLQIGDLGLADFHSEHSKSIVPPSAVDGVTETYSAPELYVAQRVSPQFDIWSFGCILLQFVVWYVHGWAGIDEFAGARIRESRGFIFPLDNFYSLDAEGTHGYVKDSVTKMFESLKKADVCSDYILDLLEYIEAHLLRVDSAKRARIEVIVDRFKVMARECHQTPHYCTERTKEARQPDSGLHETVNLEEVSKISPIEPSSAKFLPAANGEVHSRSLTAKMTHATPERTTSKGFTVNGQQNPNVDWTSNDTAISDVTAHTLEASQHIVYRRDNAAYGIAGVGNDSQEAISSDELTSRQKSSKTSKVSMSAVSLSSISAMSSASNDIIVQPPSNAATQLQDKISNSDLEMDYFVEQSPSQNQGEGNTKGPDVEHCASSATQVGLITTKSPPILVRPSLGYSQTQAITRPAHSGTAQPDISSTKPPERPRGFRQRSRELLSRVADRLCLV